MDLQIDMNYFIEVDETDENLSCILMC